MKRRWRVVAGSVLAVAVVAATGALSRFRYDPGAGDGSLLRLSWRIRGERVEECRPLTREEQAELPAHMRRDEVCEGRIAPYALEVEVDGREIARDTVHAGGAREDRPVYVHREHPLDPGTRRIEVAFRRVGEGSDRGDDRPETPAELTLNRTVEARPGSVVLVTYDGETHRLVLRTGHPGTGSDGAPAPSGGSP